MGSPDTYTPPPSPPQGRAGDSGSAPAFVFSFWTVSRPDDSYYVTNWDRKSKIEVVAADRKEAITLADAAMGDAGRDRHWVFNLISVRDVRIPVEVS